MPHLLGRLRVSTKPPLDNIRRWISRLVWGRWLLGFLFWELTGDISFTPWHTLSETAWDVEKEYPGTKSQLQAFLLGLVVHIRYQTTLESSYQWGLLMEKQFDDFVRQATPKRS